jgi:hypothetical protein
MVVKVEWFEVIGERSGKNFSGFGSHTDLRTAMKAARALKRRDPELGVEVAHFRILRVD